MKKINYKDPYIISVTTFMDFAYEDAGADAVYSEFRKFSNIILTQENVEDTLENFEKIKLHNTNMLGLYKKDFKAFRKHLLPENRHLLTDIEYCLLGANYVFKELTKFI